MYRQSKPAMLRSLWILFKISVVCILRIMYFWYFFSFSETGHLIYKLSSFLFGKTWISPYQGRSPSPGTPFPFPPPHRRCQAPTPNFPPCPLADFPWGSHSPIRRLSSSNRCRRPSRRRPTMLMSCSSRRRTRRRRWRPQLLSTLPPGWGLVCMDPWQFGTDPDPRIHASDKWIRILLFTSFWPQDTNKKN